MFNVETKEIAMILSDYSIQNKIIKVTELLRYHYEKWDPSSKEVRLILKVELDDGRKLVVKLKNEEETSAAITEEQCQFSNILELNDVPTAHIFKSGSRCVNEYKFNDYEVFVTVEAFKEGQVQVVDTAVAEKTGVMLTKSHNIAERNNWHVDYPVLFDPFGKNDLFFVEEFKAAGTALNANAKKLYEDILTEYERRMSFLTPLGKEPRYAVQGDISCENLFLTLDGQIGVFDFNRCGDNTLYCDVIMQALYEARLMDYPKDITKEYEDKILEAFLKGYNTERPFTEEQKKMFPHLYAVITTFWGMQILHREDSFINLCNNCENDKILLCLQTMKEQINTTKEMGIY